MEVYVQVGQGHDAFLGTVALQGDVSFTRYMFR
jgi:hypothetical protein